MALDEGQLADDIASFSQSLPGLAGGISKLTQAYTQYALLAQDITLDFPATVNPSGFQSVLQSGLIVGNTYATYAQVLANAVNTFWTGATFSLAFPPPGAVSDVSAVVTVPPQPSIISNPLTDELRKNTENAAGYQQAAQNIASALHEGTITTIVTDTGVGPEGAPKTVSGPIF